MNINKSRVLNQNENFLLIFINKQLFMGSIQGVISDEHGVAPTRAYNEDSDLRTIKGPFNHSWIIYRLKI